MGVIGWNRSKNKNTSDSVRSVISIDDFAKIFGEKVNEIILTHNATTGQKYIEGTFQIEYVDENTYCSAYELYFQDENNEFYKVESQSKPMPNGRLTLEARKELAEEKIITFEIPEPSQAERDVYSGNVSVKNALKDIFDIFIPKK